MVSPMWGASVTPSASLTGLAPRQGHWGAVKAWVLTITSITSCRHHVFTCFPMAGDGMKPSFFRWHIPSSIMLGWGSAQENTEGA